MTSLLELMRPKQWIKNFFVFAAIIFSGNFLNINILKLNLVTFIVFCFTSSIIYIINDIVDIDKDRIHPEKRHRPLPSGRVAEKDAIILCIFLFLAVVVVSNVLLNIEIFGIMIAYIIINIFYCFKLKNIVIIDVMTITLGFVLRVESGSIATGVMVSPWLFLCTVLLSLFLALNKRKSEIITLKDKSSDHRKILKEYSINNIDKMLTMINPSILMSYCLYTFSSVQSKTMVITIPFVIYGVFRYEYLVDKSNIGGKPEEVFLKDRAFLFDIILWIVSVIVIIYLKL